MPDPFARSIFMNPAAGLPTEEQWVPEDLALLENKSAWVLWFAEARKHLDGLGCGPEWTVMLKLGTILEGRVHFSNETTSRLKKDLHPPEIDNWVRCGQRSDVVISKPKGFAKVWWGWQMELQPVWRKKWREKRYMFEDCNTVGGDWSTLRKPGVNSFYSILVALGWWAVVVAKKPMAVLQKNWVEARMDVEWVLWCLLDDGSSD